MKLTSNRTGHEFTFLIPSNSNLLTSHIIYLPDSTNMTNVVLRERNFYIVCTVTYTTIDIWATRYLDSLYGSIFQTLCVGNQSIIKPMFTKHFVILGTYATFPPTGRCRNEVKKQRYHVRNVPSFYFQISCNYGNLTLLLMYVSCLIWEYLGRHPSPT